MTQHRKSSSNRSKSDFWKVPSSFFLALFFACFLLIIHQAKAEEAHSSTHEKHSTASSNIHASSHQNNSEAHHEAHILRPDSLGPIGVMAAHSHKKGGLMLSYRHMLMAMEGNQIGRKKLSPKTIVTSIPNRFFGRPGQPPTLRVVPLEMTMNMHMFGAMYAPSDAIMLMLMFSHVEKSMEHITFAGPQGINPLGVFTTESSGFGDIKASIQTKIWKKDSHQFYSALGLSLPTGSISEVGVVLTPMGTRPTARLPYAMQMGSGTFAFLPAFAYVGSTSDFSWGLQYRGTIHVKEKNSAGYRLGNKHAVTGWLSYKWAPWISSSVRFDAMTQDAIHGQDPLIVAPVQTANPMNYGKECVDLLLGINIMGQEGYLKGHRFSVEWGQPIYQDLNGPQMATDWVLTVGWQKAF